MGEYFYHSIIRKTTTAFGSFFNNIQIHKKNKELDTIDIVKVGLSVNPPQKFLTRLNQQSELDQPVEIVLPLMCFEMTGVTYDGERQNQPTKKFKTIDKKGNTIIQTYVPVAYNMEFELNIMSKLESDAFQIIEQILPYFRPALTVSIDLIESIGEKRDIPITLNSIDFTNDYEGDFSSRTVILWTLRFTAQSYLFGPINDSDDGLIRKVQVDYHLKHNAPREVRYTVTPKPIDADPEDDYGFDGKTELLLDSKVYSPTQNIDYTPEQNQ